MTTEHKPHSELFKTVRGTIGMWRYKREGDWDKRVQAAHDALDGIEEQLQTAHQQLTAGRTSEAELRQEWLDLKEQVEALRTEAEEQQMRWLEERDKRVELEEQYQALRQAVAEAMTSLSTGPMKDGYAYSVLEEATADSFPASEPS